MVDPRHLAHMLDMVRHVGEGGMGRGVGVAVLLGDPVLLGGIGHPLGQAPMALSVARSVESTARETNGGTKVTMSMPPLAGSRARIESGTLRG